MISRIVENLLHLPWLFRTCSLVKFRTWSELVLSYNFSVEQYKIMNVQITDKEDVRTKLSSNAGKQFHGTSIWE